MSAFIKALKYTTISTGKSMYGKNSGENNG